MRIYPSVYRNFLNGEIKYERLRLREKLLCKIQHICEEHEITEWVKLFRRVMSSTNTCTVWINMSCDIGCYGHHLYELDLEVNQHIYLRKSYTCTCTIITSFKHAIKQQIYHCCTLDVLSLP